MPARGRSEQLPAAARPPAAADRRREARGRRRQPRRWPGRQSGRPPRPRRRAEPAASARVAAGRAGDRRRRRDAGESTGAPREPLASSARRCRRSPSEEDGTVLLLPAAGRPKSAVFEVDGLQVAHRRHGSVGLTRPAIRRRILGMRRAGPHCLSDVAAGPRTGLRPAAREPGGVVRPLPASASRMPARGWSRTAGRALPPAAPMPRRRRRHTRTRRAFSGLRRTRRPGAVPDAPSTARPADHASASSKPT